MATITFIMCGCSNFTSHSHIYDLNPLNSYSSLTQLNKLKKIPSTRLYVSNNIKKRKSSYKSSNKEQFIFDKTLTFCQTAQELWQKGELNNALEALDEAYSLILSVDTRHNFKLAKQKYDLRFSISKRIFEIYTSRNTMVNGNYNEIRREINHHVQNEINRFTTGSEKFFLPKLIKNQVNISL